MVTTTFILYYNQCFSTRNWVWAWILPKIIQTHRQIMKLLKKVGSCNLRKHQPKPWRNYLFDVNLYGERGVIWRKTWCQVLLFRITNLLLPNKFWNITTPNSGIYSSNVLIFFHSENLPALNVSGFRGKIWGIF